MPLSKRTLRWIAVLIFLAGAGVRLYLAFGQGRIDAGRAEIQKMAIAFLEKGYLGDPYAAPTGPSAHAAPLYPLLQALLYAVCGDNHIADQVRVGFTILLAALEYSLLPFLSQRLGLGLLPGLCAGVFGALIPLHYWGESFGVFENTLAALGLLFLTLLAGPALTGAPGRTPRSPLFWGVAAGLCALLAPTTIPVLLGMGALTLLRARPARRQVVMACLAFVLTLLPWTIRNRVVLGDFVLVRSNFGLELAVSNFDGAKPQAVPNIDHPHYLQIHPHASRAAALRVKEVGEVAYHRRMMDLAKSWIRRHPGEFIRLSFGRGLAFWFMDSTYAWHRAALALVPLLALAAICVLARQAHPAAALLFFVPLSYSLIFLLVQNHIRYQHPIWWALWLAAWVLPARALETRVLKSKLPR